MRQFTLLLLLAALTPSWGYGDDDAQYIQPVKGGHGVKGWLPGGSQYRPQQNGSQFGSGAGYGMGHSMVAEVDQEVGVCYIEVPTANLARDRSHVPAGNGSRPDLSRIRSCCKGYERNIYNYRKCDPVCTTECVNALCVAPDTCSCYPDHVKNLAGVCIPTCPIGCQNGHCSGGECMCKEGYKLDRDSQFCIPHCRDNCGGIGNCTAPNVCDCNKEGYHSTSDGSCRAACDRCVNGDCVAPNQCRCHQGYELDFNGDCKPLCQQSCGASGRCVSPNVCEYQTTTRRPGAVYPQPHGYPTEFVTQYPPRQPQYPASQHSFNPSNPQSSQGQRYPSGPGHNITTTEDTQYSQHGISTNVTFNPQPYYPQYNSSQNVQYPGYPYQPLYPQYNSSQNVQNPLYPQGPSYPNHNTTIRDQYPKYPQESSHTQYPSGPSQYPSYPQHSYPQQYNTSSPSQYPGNPQQPSYPTGPHYPPNSQPSTNYRPTDYGQHSAYPIDQSVEVGSAPCSQRCINATCIEGDICACIPGHIPDRDDPTESRCVPYCPGGCPNGVCVAPYSCACIEGYKWQSLGVKGARPRCVRRDRRSLDNEARSKRNINVADLLVYKIPDYDY